MCVGNTQTIQLDVKSTINWRISVGRLNRRILIAGLWLIISATCVARIGHADNSRGAKKAFKEGAVLFEKQKYVEAAEKFRQAYDIRPNWKLLYNIGQCEAAARHYGLALEFFESYMAAGGDNIGTERTNELIAEMERLRNLVGYIEFKSVPATADVIIDDAHRGTSPLPGPLAVAAGATHHVSIRKDEEVLLDRVIRVHSGQTIDISIGEAETGDIQTVKREAATEVTENDNSEPAAGVDESNENAASAARFHRLKIAGWTTLGTGAATLIAGSITGAVALSKKKELEPNCPNGNCEGEYAEDEEKLQTLGTTTDVLLGVGAGIAVTGIVLLIVARVKGKKSTEQVSILPSIGDGMAGFITVGAF
jgi:hypothetical protein